MTDLLDLITEAALLLRRDDCALGHRGPWEDVFKGKHYTRRSLAFNTQGLVFVPPPVIWRRCRHCGEWKAA